MKKKTTPIEQPDVVVQEPVTQEKSEITESKVPAPTTLQPKKKRKSIKGLFWVLAIVVIGGSFTAFGIVVERTILPAAKTWLVDHRFVDAEKMGEENSPFVANQSDGKNNTAHTIPEIVSAASPSVVSIAISDAKLAPKSVEEERNTVGTGFIVSKDGIIVTNQHVVSDNTVQYVVVTRDNQVYTPTKIIKDEVNDIAFIIIQAQDLPALNLGKSADIKVGETVIAIGNPLGQYPGSVTVGVVSGIGRTVMTGDNFWGIQKEYDNVIQTDAAINPGNSGGPLLNLSGEVIGVNFATTSGADNISFALPSATLVQKLQEYQEFGKFKNAYLGVSFRMITAQEATTYGVVTGALVRSIAPTSPAASGDLQVGDIITHVNDIPVKTTLSSNISKFKVGDTVTLKIYRPGNTTRGTVQESLTVTVTLGDRP